MAKAASQDEQMPYGMAERQLLIRIKQNARAIKQTARKKPRDRSKRQCFDHGLNRDYDKPTHRQINCVRKNFEFFYVK